MILIHKKWITKKKNPTDIWNNRIFSIKNLIEQTEYLDSTIIDLCKVPCCYNITLFWRSMPYFLVWASFCVQLGVPVITWKKKDVRGLLNVTALQFHFYFSVFLISQCRQHMYIFTASGSFPSLLAELLIILELNWKTQDIWNPFHLWLNVLEDLDSRVNTDLQPLM